MMAGRGWVNIGGKHTMLVFQIGGLLLIAGLIVALVMMRKRDGSVSVSKTKSSTRI